MSDTVSDDRLTAWRKERQQEAAKARKLRLEEKQQQRDLAELKLDVAAEELLTEHDGRSAFLADIEAREVARARAKRRRLIACILGPVAAALLWCFWLVTPLYLTSASFVVLSPQADTAQSSSAFFVAQDLTDRNHGAFLAVTLIDAQNGASDTDQRQAYSKWRAALDHRIAGVWPQSTTPVYVTSALNIQSGVVTLNSFAPNPEDAKALAEQTLSSVAAQINQIYGARTQSRVDDAAMRLETAENELHKAVLAVHELRQTYGDIDPTTRLSELNQQIADLTREKGVLETQLKSLELSNGAQTPQAVRYRALIADFEERIETLRNPQGHIGLEDLSAASLAFERAEFALSLTQERLGLAQARFEDAIKASTLSRDLLQIVVEPTRATGPSYPQPVSLVFLALILGFVLFTCLELLRPKTPN